MIDKTESGIERAVRKAGSQRALATALGVTQAEVWRWADRGWVPVQYIVHIESEYEIPRRELVNPRFADLLSKDLGED